MDIVNSEVSTLILTQDEITEVFRCLDLQRNTLALINEYQLRITPKKTGFSVCNTVGDRVEYDAESFNVVFAVMAWHAHYQRYNKGQ